MSITSFPIPTSPLASVASVPQVGSSAEVLVNQAGLTVSTPIKNITRMYDVKAYGAVGDGTTNDTAALQACYAAAPYGATVLWPPGNYVQTAPITIGSDRITTLGMGATIISNATGQDRKFTVSGRTGVVFRGLRIDGGGYTTLSVASAFDTYSPRSHPGTIHFSDCTSCEVDDCKFTGVNWPITILGACVEIDVHFCRFEQYYAAVYSYFSDASGQPQPRRVSIKHNKFFAGKHRAFAFPAGQYDDRDLPPDDIFCSGAIKFRGENASDPKPWNVSVNHIISHNTIRDSGQMGIEVQGCANDTIVSTNSISSVMTGISLSVIGRVSVSTNTIRDTIYAGIEVDGRTDFNTSQRSNESIHLQGNIIDGRDDWDRPVNFVNNFGIVVSNISRHVVISGGAISWCKTGVCVMSLSENVTIDGVDFVTNAESGYGGTGGYVSGVIPYVQGVLVQDSSRVDIIGCHFDPQPSAWQRMINLINATKINIRGCTITSNNTGVYAFKVSDLIIEGGTISTGPGMGGSNTSFVTVDSSDGNCANISLRGVTLRGSANYGVLLFSPDHTISPVVIEGVDTTQASCSAAKFLTVDTAAFGSFPGGTAGQVTLRNNISPAAPTKQNAFEIPVVVVDGNAGAFTDDISIKVMVTQWDAVINLQSAAGRPGTEKLIITSTTGPTVTLNPVSGQTINGASGAYVLTSTWSGVRLVSDGSNWLAFPAPAFGGLQQIGTAEFTNDFGTVAAGAQAYCNVTVPCPSGTARKPTVAVGWSGNLPVGVVYKQGFISGTNQATIVIHNTTGSDAAVGTMSGRVSVFQS